MRLVTLLALVTFLPSTTHPVDRLYLAAAVRFIAADSHEQPQPSDTLRANADQTRDITPRPEDATVAGLRAEVAALREFESRTWNMLLGVILALLTVVIGGSITMVVLPRRLVRNATKRAQEELIPLFEAAKAEILEHKSSSKSEIEAVADRISRLVREQGIVLTGRLLYHNGKPDEAIDLLSDYLSTNPTSADALYYRGLSYKKKGRDHLTSAIRDLDAALGTSEYRGDGPAHYDVAEALFRAGQLDKAEDAAQRALDLGFRNRASALTLLGNTLRLRGERGHDRDSIQESLRRYDACLAIAPWHSAAIEGKAKALTSLQNYDDAIRLCEETIAAGQDLSNYRAHAASAYWTRNGPGDREAALEHLAVAQRRNPRDTRPWELEGGFLARLAAESSPAERTPILQRARKALARGRDIAAPGYRPVLRNRLCGVLLALGDRDAAVQEAEAAVADNPRYVTNWMSLSATCFAAHAWQRALEAATEGNRRAVAPPGRRWCTLLALLARSFQGYSVNELQSDHLALDAEVANTKFRLTHPWIADVLINTIESCRSSLSPSSAELVDHWLARLRIEPSSADVAFEEEQADA